MVYVDRHACLELTIPSVIGHSCVFTSVVVSKTERIACRIDLEDPVEGTSNHQVPL